VDIGAIVAPVQLEKIRELVARGEAEGATLWQPSWSCPTEGCFYPPTLFTGVSPSSTVAQVEIFGPVVVLMTFRTPAEAVELANNTQYGLAASVWTENVNLALDVAPKVKAGTVWINSTNLFDAASGFGGYRESGFGREGGIEGLWEYVKPRWEAEAKTAPRKEERKAKPPKAEKRSSGPALPPIDRTAKLYIGGKQARPDSGYSMPVLGPGERVVGEVGLGNRKDVRNAVEAAHKAKGWSRGTAHNRAQVLYYLAENLAARADEFARRIAAMTGDEGAAEREVEASVRRLYTYAAWADKYDGRVHATPLRNVTIAMNEPIGVAGVLCPDAAPLLGFVSTVMPLVAMGNAVVAVPSERWPLAATDFYQVLDTSDVPGGVVNIVTGRRDELMGTLAAHDDVEALWYFGSAAGSAEAERLSAGNMKRTWVSHGRERDWLSTEQGEGPEFLRQATHVKNIWVPYGE
jgi:aldehyde dehydrogenase (NAD+)